MPKVQPIFRENAGALPAEYVLPAGLDLVLSSVVARFDGAGAAATFVPVLEVLTQDAKLIARVRPDQTFAVGDTGVVTFAPFLRRQAAAAAAATKLPGFHGHKNSTLILATGGDGRLNWDEWTIDGGTTFFQEGALVGADLSEVKLMLAGWYAIECWASWSAEPASGFAGIAAVDDDTDIAEPRKAQGMTYPLNFSSAPALCFQQVRFYPAVFTQTQTFAFVNRLEFWVVQNSGVNRTINEAYANIVYLGERLT